MPSDVVSLRRELERADSLLALPETILENALDILRLVKEGMRVSELKAACKSDFHRHYALRNWLEKHDYIRVEWIRVNGRRSTLSHLYVSVTQRGKASMEKCEHLCRLRRTARDISSASLLSAEVDYITGFVKEAFIVGYGELSPAHESIVQKLKD